MKKSAQFAAGIVLILVISCKSTTESQINEKNNDEITDNVEVTITEKEVNDAQQAWCDALVKIGKIHTEGGDAKAFAKQVLADAYHYDEGKVFFKPTLAFGQNTFRNTKEGALSYFVGGDSNFPEDKGFALTPWVKTRFDNAGEGNNGIQIYGNIAIKMGNVWVTDKNGKEVMVDKTFVFQESKRWKT